MTARHLLLPLLALGLSLCLRAAETSTPYTRTEDVVYGRKYGMALTLDTFEPQHKNGAAIIWVVSSGYVSDHSRIHPDYFEPLLARGYTIFAVCHGCQPRFTLSEMGADIHHAVRFIRLNAQRWNIDPNRIGISGASAGGHFSLIIGTEGGPGNPAAKDAVDRESSAVQAVACFFPPTDYANWSKPGELWHDFPRMQIYTPAFGPPTMTHPEWVAQAPTLSAITYVAASMPPTLIYQGALDEVVPLYQAQHFQARCKEVGAVCVVVVKPGAKHSYPGFPKDIAAFADWFDKYLPTAKP